jgi:drug/metabolite transporter (DMT)-like permease
MESVFTVVLARALFREHVGARALSGLGLVALGGAVLVISGHDLGGARASLPGALVVVAATLAWAADNALTRPLAELDPTRVILAKAGLGAVLASSIAVALGEPLPTPGAAIGLLVCGATGYGVSLRLYLAAQRTLGAARTASVFAVAPFVGAGVAVALGDRPPGVASAIAAALCAIGVAVHLTERHTHRHSHAAATHEHAHRHDDGHHDHTHGDVPGAPLRGEHSHVHSHAAVVHDHDHAPDVHHAHDHEQER